MVLVSGDIHLAEMNLALCSAAGTAAGTGAGTGAAADIHSGAGSAGGDLQSVLPPPLSLIEMTTSGITHAWRRGYIWGVPALGPSQVRGSPPSLHVCLDWMVK